MLKEKVLQLLDIALEEHPKLFLIDFNIDLNNDIKVILDGDEGVSLSDCIAVSRAIEHNIDRDEFDFSLEVASAGASSPLTMPRQYKKNIGRILEVKTLDGQTVEGTLTEVSENGINLQWKAREPKPVGKGKITVDKSLDIPFENIKESKVKIIFN
ncbi:ribosome assembly cofactor RimP [Planktosalinus lacus]|uniref:Ribosome maturation factor RimP n=1 Tax=Planktosalinus lacus TaxID=1526573 RepID=A0A8J2V7J8_9FLAO|nr:ribosome assembly cofactor RimP [Planktosalinus lacus]GGD82900.1 ribosome maturation factor RimP [Planktosalinus lacus]